jgi:hypothetical protein
MTLILGIHLKLLRRWKLEAKLMIADVLTGLVVNKLGQERMHVWAGYGQYLGSR